MTTSSLIYPGITPITFQIGITLVSTLLTSLTCLCLDTSRIRNSCLALPQEMGKLGIDGILVPSVRVAFSYDGYPGVVGSPGYKLMNWTLPR